jgi:hypothetical protein
MADLSRYEIAYLCGDEERVAQVALLALAVGERVELSLGRRRVRPRNDGAGTLEPVEAQALALVPDFGMTAALFVERASACAAVEEVAVAVRRLGLRRRLLGFRTKAYRRLLADPGTGLRRVAVLGPEGLEDERLRDLFELPALGIPAVPRHKPIPSNELNGEAIGVNRDAWIGASSLLP